MLTLQRLDVYRAAIDFVVHVRKVRGACPRGTADLQDQLRRAAQSIAQNIAEGVGKTTRPDKAKFFAIARGSAMECVAHFDVLRAEEIVDPADHETALVLLERIVAMLTKLIRP